MKDPGTPAVSASGLVKRYGARRAVDGVDLHVPRGSIYGILGPNGAGKSTTLRMLLGIIEPDAGTRTMLGSPRPSDVSDRVGFLPEERSLYQNMRCREAIAFLGAMRGLPWREGRRRADALLDEAGLGDVAGTRIRKLSKGMAQYVQLISAMVHEPDLLVLDEPFSGLDPVNQEALENMILRQRDRGATVLFSTHVMGHAERLCDRLSIIAGGRVRFEGRVDEARALLPQRVRYVPKAMPGDLAAVLPADAMQDEGGWSFRVPADGLEDLVVGLAASGYGIARLSVEDASLHDAFVHIVGKDAEEERRR
jgi:ABC-2 type transport system ATP-binding protein